MQNISGGPVMVAEHSVRKTTHSPALTSPKATRVLIYGINYAPEPTGVGRYTGELGAYLSDENIEVAVIAAVPHYPGWAVLSGYRNRYSTERAGKMRVVRCPLILRTEMRGIWRLIAPLSFAITSAPVAIWRILVTRPNTVLCIEPTLFVAPVALLAAKLVGARTVLHVQDLEIDAAFAVGHLRGGWLSWVAATFERALLRSFDRVVTISVRMQERLEAKGVSQKRLALVRNWVHLGKIRPLSGVSAYRRELDLPDDAYIALYAGNIGAKQGLSVLLEAASHLPSAGRTVFLVVGDGPEKNRLVSRYGHLANVRFLAVQPEERLCELLNVADIHLLPQDRDTADLVLPSKLGGMLASGRPCIVMADPGTELHDFLGDGAIFAPPGDSKYLAQLIWLYSQKDQPIQLGDNTARTASLDAKLNLFAFQEILIPPGVK